MIEFKLPELGENIEQGDLVRLMVAPGAAVSAGQSVMELETDKAVVEVPSSVSGTVQEIRVKEGDKIKVGQVIFTVDGAEAKANAAAAQSAPVASPPTPKNSPAPVVAKEPSKPAAPPEPVKPAATSTASEFKLPELGENITQGDLVRLMVAPGTRVSEGQPVMMEIVDEAGSGLALPAQTLYLGRDAGLEKEKTDTAVKKIAELRDEKQLPFPDFHQEDISSFKGSIDYPPSESTLRQGQGDSGKGR